MKNTSNRPPNENIFAGNNEKNSSRGKQSYSNMKAKRRNHEGAMRKPHSRVATENVPELVSEPYIPWEKRAAVEHTHADKRGEGSSTAREDYRVSNYQRDERRSPLKHNFYTTAWIILLVLVHGLMANHRVGGVRPLVDIMPATFKNVEGIRQIWRGKVNTMAFEEDSEDVNTPEVSKEDQYLEEEEEEEEEPIDMATQVEKDGEEDTENDVEEEQEGEDDNIEGEGSEESSEEPSTLNTKDQNEDVEMEEESGGGEGANSEKELVDSVTTKVEVDKKEDDTESEPEVPTTLNKKKHKETGGGKEANSGKDLEDSVTTKEEEDNEEEDIEDESEAPATLNKKKHKEEDEADSERDLEDSVISKEEEEDIEKEDIEEEDIDDESEAPATFNKKKPKEEEKVANSEKGLGDSVISNGEEENEDKIAEEELDVPDTLTTEKIAENKKSEKEEAETAVESKKDDVDGHPVPPVISNAAEERIVENAEPDDKDKSVKGAVKDLVTSEEEEKVENNVLNINASEKPIDKKIEELGIEASGTLTVDEKKDEGKSESPVLLEVEEKEDQHESTDHETRSSSLSAEEKNETNEKDAYENKINSVEETQEIELMEQYQSDLLLLEELMLSTPSLEELISNMNDNAIKEKKEHETIIGEMKGMTLMLAESKASLEKWEVALEKAELALSTYSEGTNMNRTLGNDHNAMEELANVSPLETFPLFESDRIGIPGENCSGAADAEYANNNNTGEVLLNRGKFENALSDLIHFSKSTSQSIINNENQNSFIRAWIVEEIEQARGENFNDRDDDVGFPPEHVHHEIKKRLDIESADRTGLVDYASIRQGASVVRNKVKGKLTSPSLTDTLPPGNRIMEAFKMRFYGYPPEVALSINNPKNSLGQCWAFKSIEPAAVGYNKNESQFDMDAEGNINEALGNTASLTVKLSQPVKVTSVVVEHPAKEITPHAETAIKEFRVFGYEDENGESYPWLLGSFMYDLAAPLSLQEFMVARKFDGGDIPELQSITLAIDSNWGYEYSCLYRLRVHGST